MGSWQACLLSGLLLCVCAAQECQQGVSVAAPRLVVPGRAAPALVSLLGRGRQDARNVTLRLSPSRAELPAAEASAHVRGHGLVVLDIPSGAAAGDYSLEALVEGGCPLRAASSLQLAGAVRDVLVTSSRRGYRPGDTVVFWVLALDYDLRLPSDVFGGVFLEDPRGVTIALWQQVALHEGVQNFSCPLSAVATLGRWQVRVEAAGRAFSTQFDVSPTGGSTVGGSAPEVAMAEEHFVELRFGRAMRRLYKPGLPFFGKVEAASTERSVRVRVKVYDNTTAIYSQDIEMSSGEGSFEVPAILADSDVITLQAELVSVEGKEIDSHYVLAREPIRKWNSSSDCYLLIEGVDHTLEGVLLRLQPGERARVSVLSTCACERELHHVVTTEGVATSWGSQQQPGAPAGGDRPPGQGVDGTAICRLDLSLEVKAVMAPVSQLLVYYVTEDGEPISDVVSFKVTLQRKQVSAELEQRDYWRPRERLGVQVSAAAGSLVCLLGSRAGGEASDRWRTAPADASVSPEAPARGLDFLEAGLSYVEQRCHAVVRQLAAGGARRSLRASFTPAAEADLLWLGSCFNYSSSEQVVVEAPGDPGNWTLWALEVSPSQGLGLSPPAPLVVFQPLQVDFRLPFSLKVGETVEVDVRIGNNVESCVDVTALLSLGEGAHFLSNSLLYVTERLRLGPRGATSLVVRVVVTSGGEKNMTVEVTGYGGCQEAGGARCNGSLVGSVSASASVLVHPEGLVVTRTESAYFCANEKLVVSPSQSSSYEFVAAPRGRASVVFEARVREGAHVVLSEAARPTEAMLHVVIGGDGNAVTWIGRGASGLGVRLASARTPGVVSAEEFRAFWVSWALGRVAVGLGSEPHNRTLLGAALPRDRGAQVRHVGFATAWGRAGEFRVWSYNDEAGFSQVLHLDVPRSLVPGTEQGTLLVAGGLAAPLAARRHLRHRGLGLGECSSLASTVASFTQLLASLDARDSPSDAPSEQQAARSLSLQLQQLLSFMKPDHSFGDHQLLGSHRDSVEALLLLARLQARASVDPGLLARARRWVQARQAADGSFPPLPADRAEPALGAVVELTAETLAALLEVGFDSEEDAAVGLRARGFLEASLPRVGAPLPLAALAYALALAQSGALDAALARLRGASTNEEGDFGWQPSPPDDPPRGETGARDSDSIEEYKASLYTLMTFSYLEDLKSAEPVARYLFYRSHILDKHTEVVQTAARALARFRALAGDGRRALTVSLATSGMELTDTVQLRARSAARRLQLPSLPTKVFVYATGAGCATIQGQVRYSTYAPARRSPLLELWAGVEDEVVFGHDLLEQVEGRLPLLKLKTCFRWKGSEPSGVLRLEVTLFSGFHLESVSPAVLDSSGKMTSVHHGALQDRIWFVLANVSGSCAVCLRYSARGGFAVASLRPAFARVHPAGRRDLGAAAFFHTRRASPLLAGVTDDDVITWFGGEPQLSSNFSSVCECGRVCPAGEAKKTAARRQKAQDVANTLLAGSGLEARRDSSNISDSVKAGLKLDKTSELLRPAEHNEVKEKGQVGPRTVNRDKAGAAPPPAGRNEKLLVVDKDALWGMLKEVVHVELGASKNNSSR